MRTSLIFFAAFCFCVARAAADSTTAAVQQKLKDQGFYYGEVNGTNDADTTAAIRRYQIRNGLKITGELNAETQKSLGVRGSMPEKSAPPAAPRRESDAPAGKSSPVPNTSDLRDSDPAPPRAPIHPQPGYAPGPGGLYPATGGVFDGPPFQGAPADVQRRVVIGAQTLLARRGYYRELIDGDFGPGTVSAVRAYQSRFGLAPSGRLDRETLAALGLLPGQRAPGIDVPRGRIHRPPVIPRGTDERVYIPR